MWYALYALLSIAKSINMRKFIISNKKGPLVLVDLLVLIYGKNYNKIIVLLIVAIA